jgi:hypothetical protein
MKRTSLESGMAVEFHGKRGRESTCNSAQVQSHHYLVDDFSLNDSPGSAGSPEHCGKAGGPALPKVPTPHLVSGHTALPFRRPHGLCHRPAHGDPYPPVLSPHQPFVFIVSPSPIYFLIKMLTTL